MSWMQVEQYLESDDRCVLPIGSTEQHGALSLCVDAILAERVAVEAAEPTNVPVYPVMPFGCAPYFAAFPGSISLEVDTLFAVVRDVVGSLYGSGFRRVLIVNGHGGNAAVGDRSHELTADHPGLSIKFHDWWRGPRVMDRAREIAPNPSHANWFENFPWTRLADVTLPSDDKPVVDTTRLKLGDPAEARKMLGDGSFGGAYQVTDDQMLDLWAVGVEETRSELQHGWPNRS